jgi:NitT/TauT family transport system permease protein
MSALSQPAKWEKFFWPLLTASVGLVIWYYAVEISKTSIFPTPAAVIRGMTELARKGVLLNDIADSLHRVAVGYLTAAFLGVPIGLMLGWYPAANRVVNPFIQLVRPISPIAWIPLAIIWFGVGDAAATYLIFVGSFFPIVVASANGARNVPSIYRRAGRNFGLNQVSLLAKVVFPAALPQIIIGLRISLGIAWLVVVAAEMVAVESGLGYLVIDSRNSGKRYDLVVAAMVMIGVIGLLLDVGFRWFEKLKSVRWGFRQES